MLAGEGAYCIIAHGVRHSRVQTARARTFGAFHSRSFYSGEPSRIQLANNRLTTSYKPEFPIHLTNSYPKALGDQVQNLAGNFSARHAQAAQGDRERKAARAGRSGIEK